MPRYLLLHDDPPPATPAISTTLLDGAMKTILAKPAEPGATPDPVTPPVTPPVASPATPPVTPPVAAKPTITPAQIPAAVLPGATQTPEPVSDVVLDAYEKGLPEQERAKFNAHVRVQLKRIPQLEQELATARSGKPVVDTKALEEVQTKAQQLDAQNKALEARLATYDLTATRAYQEKFIKPEESLSKQIKDVLIAFDVENPDEVLKEALSKEGTEMVKVLKQNATPATPTLFPLVTQLQQLRTAATEVQKNASEHLRQMSEQQKVAHLENLRAERDTLFNAALQNRINKGDFLVRDLPGDENWNKEVKVIRDMAKTIGESNDPAMHANAFVMAAQYPVLKDLFVQQNAELAALRQEYQALTGKQPVIHGTTPPSQPAQQSGQGQSGMDAARSILQSLKM